MDSPIHGRRSGLSGMLGGQAERGCLRPDRAPDDGRDVGPEPSHCDAILRRRVAAVSSVAELGVTIYVACPPLGPEGRRRRCMVADRGYQIVCGKGKNEGGHPIEAAPCTQIAAIRRVSRAARRSRAAAAGRQQAAAAAAGAAAGSSSRSSSRQQQRSSSSSSSGKQQPAAAAAAAGAAAAAAARSGAQSQHLLPVTDGPQYEDERSVRPAQRVLLEAWGQGVGAATNTHTKAQRIDKNRCGWRR